MEEIEGRAQASLGIVEVFSHEANPQGRPRCLPPATSCCRWDRQPPGPEVLSMHLKKKKIR